MVQNPAGNNSSELTTSHFTEHKDVKQCLEDLIKEFGPGGKPFIVSDVVDKEGHQYVNLVQKGGGVLGVALVGYTYILEKMGVRFLRLAGTSAGAINTALMTVIGEKQDEKSESILRSICALDFFKLVDGHPAARWAIKNFITNENFGYKVKKWMRWFILICILLFSSNIIFLGLENKFPFLSLFTRVSFVLTGIYFLLIGIGIYYIVRLFKRLKNSGYGINPGDYFYDWIKKELIANGVTTVSELKNKAGKLPDFHLRVPHKDNLDGLTGDVTFIASELVTQNKIQFPEMCYLFREAKDIDMLQPAGFIRASMSIPVFFESYIINDIPCTLDSIRQLWLEKMGEADPPGTARFVDGGMLSNFPINIFYNPKIMIPRLPAFGIDLDDSLPADKTKTATSWTLGGYMGRMFNTIRSYYDKDFLLQNKMFSKGIGKIHLSKFNWLNFFMKPEEKIEMFVLGAQAACEFLKNFNWEEYKNNRMEMHIELNKHKSQAIAE